MRGDQCIEVVRGWIVHHAQPHKYRVQVAADRTPAQLVQRFRQSMSSGGVLGQRTR
jgi:hypothetical protein